MKFKLPTWKKEFDKDNNVIVTDKEIAVDIDTSLLAEERWEINFPKLAERETLFAYIARIKVGNNITPANILSSLKALYCFIESKEIADYKEFLRMFDLSDIEKLNDLVTKIQEAFELVLKSSTASPKN
jgi:hypothetical protein